MPRSPSTISLRVAGLLAQGDEVRAGDDLALLPAELIDPCEVIYRLAEDLPVCDLAAGDLLVVEPRPRGNAATGELVITTLRERAYLGRWWAKHGRRALLDATGAVIVEERDLRVLGAVTLVLRVENH